MNNQLTISNGNLFYHTDKELINDDGSGASCPVGTIIAVHPLVSANESDYINTNNWTKCNSEFINVYPKDDSAPIQLTFPSGGLNAYFLGGSSTDINVDITSFTMSANISAQEISITNPNYSFSFSDGSTNNNTESLNHHHLIGYFHNNTGISQNNWYNGGGFQVYNITTGAGELITSSTPTNTHLNTSSSAPTHSHTLSSGSANVSINFNITTSVLATNVSVSTLPRYFNVVFYVRIR
jgi:hypothetical protein